MNVLNQPIFPLAIEETRKQRRSLIDCCSAACPWQLSLSLEFFLKYYHATTESYLPSFLSGSTPALGTHDDLLAIIGTLKVCAGVRRNAITKAHFAQRAAVRGETGLPLLSDQHRAFSLAARIIAMVNSSTEDQADELLESGALPVNWRDDTSFAEFLEMAFPMQVTVDVAETGQQRHLGLSHDTKWSKLTAKRLKRIAGLRFIPTDNLQNHLRLDVKRKTVDIYHHTGVLSQHLLPSVKCDAHDDTARGIFEGNIPRRLALETLVTIKVVLFPLESDSQSLFRTPVLKKSFDTDCLQVDLGQYRRVGEETVSFRYWSARLADLHDQMDNPSPTGFLEKWLERRSGGRYVMMATLGGVLTAIVLGALSLAVSIFQAWVGYQQWKHPANAS